MVLLGRVRYESFVSVLIELFGLFVYSSTPNSVLVATSYYQWRREREARGAAASPMLKNMALVILPNSMRKKGVVEFRYAQITNAKYFM